MNAIRIREALEEIRHLYNTYLALLEFYRVCQTDNKNYKSFYDYKKEEEDNQHNEV